MSLGMHPEDIKAAIRKRGKTMTELSLENNLSESAVRVALKRPFPAVEPIISRFIEVPLWKIWPDRYDRENIRIRPVSNGRKSKTKSRMSHCKKSSS